MGINPGLSRDVNHGPEDALSIGLATSRSERGPVGIAGGRFSCAEGFKDSLDTVGVKAGPIGSLEGSLCLYDGAVPNRGPEGIFGGRERSAAGAAGGFGSIGTSSFRLTPSVEMWLVVGVKLGRIDLETGSVRLQES